MISESTSLAQLAEHAWTDYNGAKEFGSKKWKDRLLGFEEIPGNRSACLFYGA